MSTTVLAPSGLEISTRDSSAEEMLASLAKPDEKEKSPRVLVDKGEPVKAKGKAEGEESDTSKAASVLGKKGGEAAAEARKAKDKAEAKGKDEKPAEKATDADKATETAEAEKKKGEGNPRHDPEARVRQSRQEVKEANERAERAERALEQERRQREQDRRVEARPAVEERREEQRRRPEQATGPQAPKSEDFNTYEEYLDARDEHREQVRAHRQRVEQHHDEYAGFVVGKVKEFADRVSAVTKDDPTLLDDMADLNMVTSFRIERGSNGRPSIARAERITGEHLVGDEIVRSEVPALLIRHFAENRAEYQRIAALGSPLEIQRAMAKLEGRLERAEAATADTSSVREVSRAGNPGRSVSGTPNTAAPDLANSTFEQHMDAKRRARA